MDLNDNIQALAARVVKQLDCIKTEAATKTALVMPFISALGYDVFDPTEVIPELIAEVGVEESAKVDYGIVKDGKITMLFECKPCTCNLDGCQTSQLDRYFCALKARIGVLTNGIVYRFYSDLQHPNKMDQKPFLECDLLNLREPVIAEMKKLTKSGLEQLWSHWVKERVDTLQQIVETLQGRTTELEVTIANLRLQPSLEPTGAEPDTTRQKTDELEQKVEQLQQKANELEWKITESRLNESFDAIEAVPNRIQFLRRRGYSIQLEQVVYEPRGLRLLGYFGNPTSMYLHSVSVKFSTRKWPSKIEYFQFQSKGLPFLWTPKEIGSVQTRGMEIIPPGERHRFEVTVPNVKPATEGFQLYVSLASGFYSYRDASERRPQSHEDRLPIPFVARDHDSDPHPLEHADAPNCTPTKISDELPLEDFIKWARLSWTDRVRPKRFPRSA